MRDVDRDTDGDESASASEVQCHGLATAFAMDFVVKAEKKGKDWMRVKARSSVEMRVEGTPEMTTVGCKGVGHVTRVGWGTLGWKCPCGG